VLFFFLWFSALRCRICTLLRAITFMLVIDSRSCNPSQSQHFTKISTWPQSSRHEITMYRCARFLVCSTRPFFLTETSIPPLHEIFYLYFLQLRMRVDQCRRRPVGHGPSILLTPLVGVTTLKTEPRRMNSQAREYQPQFKAHTFHHNKGPS
jgi:hypothetical protein